MGAEQVAVIPPLPEHHFETCIVLGHAFHPYPHAQVGRVNIDLFDQFSEVRFGHVSVFWSGKFEAKGYAEDNCGMNKLFDDIPADLGEEFFETLASSEHVRIERIVSNGHVSPGEGWYDQERHEFVVLMSGAARLEFEDGSVFELAPGDCLNIPAHQKHRVAWTDKSTETVWLAVHYE